MKAFCNKHYQAYEVSVGCDYCDPVGKINEATQKLVEKVKSPTIFTISSLPTLDELFLPGTINCIYGDAGVGKKTFYNNKIKGSKLFKTTRAVDSYYCLFPYLPPTIKSLYSKIPKWLTNNKLYDYIIFVNKEAYTLDSEIQAKDIPSSTSLIDVVKTTEYNPKINYTTVIQLQRASTPYCFELHIDKHPNSTINHKIFVV